MVMVGSDDGPDVKPLENCKSLHSSVRCLAFIADRHDLYLIGATPMADRPSMCDCFSIWGN